MRENIDVVLERGERISDITGRETGVQILGTGGLILGIGELISGRGAGVQILGRGLVLG